MITTRFAYKVSLMFFVVLFSCFLQAQSSKQRELESRRQNLQREIQQFATLLSQGKKEEKSITVKVEDINYKVTILQNLISVTNQQANLLTREINNNIKTISKLRDKLKILKEDYAKMIVKSYKSKSEQSKVMFLLSSTNFQQAYKRLQYIKQYANYQKEQGELIRKETLELQELNKNLVKQKESKQKLIEANRASKSRLDEELKEQKQLFASIRKDLNKYTSQIRTKRREADRLDKEIEKIIRDAIASSNAKAGKSSSSKTFALTSEGRALAANFISNKGKLPWPVERGVVKVRYGTQKSPINKSVPINSNGVRIATNKNAKVRSVFEGTVQSIIVPKNGNNTILIRHGDFFTIYKNLSKIFVKKGDKVFTKQQIGETLTNKADGETILGFLIWKDGKYQNPAYWIDNM
ncbi:peptidase M23 [Flavobacteriaceae bacterium AU392]|nr:peptidase M23 [Flavobacteriaceae bacterium]RKM84909.1 peptidase M23 [Flavobacteriaceae bacterium AU392]